MTLRWREFYLKAPVAASFLMVVSLCYHVLLVTTPLPASTRRATPSSDKSTGLPALPVLGTRNLSSRRVVKLNCSRDAVSGNWTEYKSTSDNIQRGQRSGGDDWKVSTKEDKSSLHKCSVLLPIPCPTSTSKYLHQVKSALGESSCGDLATLRGAGQKVASFSVDGVFPSDYHLGINKLVARIRQVYPGWMMRVYLDGGSVPKRWMCSLACRNSHLDFCDVSQLPGLGDVRGTSVQLWRFAVLGDELVERYLVRDADSPILLREVAAVRDWLRAGTCYHIMRDHPFHGVPMLAGLWGGCNTWRSGEAAAARDLALCNTTLSDQAVLKGVVWPVARLNVTVHDSYTCRRFPGAKPFPTQRLNFTFVGQRTYRRLYWRERTRAVCPQACRPKQHQDWVYC